MSNTIIGVRIPQQDRELMNKICKARGEHLSDFVRRAIRKELARFSSYPDDVKKALNIAEPVMENSTESSEILRSSTR